MSSTPIYALRVAEVFTALQTSRQGLSNDEVISRQALYGKNLLKEDARVSYWSKLFRQLLHPFALLLWLAGAIAFLIRQPASGITIWLLVLVNAGLSFWRDYRTEQAMQTLRSLLPLYSRLVRGGNEISVTASEIVPGDMLVLAEGDHIPADGRVVEAFGLRTNHSTLTGEAVPALRTSDASIREGVSELERANLVFAGTTVVSGTGLAVVFRTGMLTQFGRIAHLTQAVQDPPTPLQEELSLLSRRLTLIAIGVGALVFTVGALDVGLEFYHAFLFALGTLVAVAPEGLPATITLSLAISGQRLAQRGILVKKLSVIETLGTVSVICTDKSGTLTKNQMTVNEIWVSGCQLTVTGVGYEPKGSIRPKSDRNACQADLEALLVAAAMCNNSRLVPPTSEHPHWTCLGDQTEAAMLVASLKGGLEPDSLRQLFPRIHELPFDARRKRMSTIHHLSRQGGGSQANLASSLSAREIAFVKGAPNEILNRSTHILLQGEACLLTDDMRREILSALDEYAGRALRVLALARRELSDRKGAYTVEKVENELTFLGLMAMLDPPRPEVADAVQTCMQAGIQLVMITGDYGLTAASLARRVGMLTVPDPLIITGAELDMMNDFQVKALLESQVIFARMAPEHKMRLVSAFQEHGEVVAVTGDGVNDAPALRKADVGVAMGLTGTEVAKEAADVVITSDNFSDIVQAIAEGRSIFMNIRKFITYIFSSNVPEVLPFLFSALLNIPLALTVPQILAIDLGTDLLPGLGLGAENPEPDIMLQPPRRRSQHLIDGKLLRRAFLWLGPIEAALCYFGFILVFALSGQLEGFQLPFLAGYFPALPVELVYPLAVTVFFAGVICAQVGNALACRSETNRGRRIGWLSNRLLIAGIGVELLILLALIYIPPLAHLFNTIPIPLVFWLLLVWYAPAVYGLDWLRKLIVRKSSQLAHTPRIKPGLSNSI